MTPRCDSRTISVARRSAEQLRDLGIKPKRSMPKKLSSAGDDMEITEKFLESGLEGSDLTREDDA